MTEYERMWDYLRDETGLSDETIDLVCDILGYDGPGERTMRRILEARTGASRFPWEVGDRRG